MRRVFELKPHYSAVRILFCASSMNNGRESGLHSQKVEMFEHSHKAHTISLYFVAFQLWNISDSIGNSMHFDFGDAIL